MTISNVISYIHLINNNYETITIFCYPKELWDNNKRIQKVFSKHADGT